VLDGVSTAVRENLDVRLFLEGRNLLRPSGGRVSRVNLSNTVPDIKNALEMPLERVPGMRIYLMFKA
jgi:hypothetical protein